MAGQKQIGWGKLVATALFTAIFLLAGLINFVPKAGAIATIPIDQLPPFAWTDETHIASGTTVYRCAGDGELMLCLNPDPNDPNSPKDKCGTTIEIRGEAGTGSYQLYEGTPPVCPPAGDARTITIGGTENAPGSLSGGGTGSNGDGVDPNLECHWGANPLTWILCPVVKGINAILVQLDNAITSLLTVDQDAIFSQGNETGRAYHDAWQSFRGIALAVLLIAGLAMVIAQALGFEILDAYTIKKVLPRLLIAIIGIALSWEIMKFFVGLTNDLGTGIRYLIYYPFRGFTQQLELDGGAQFLLNIVGAGAIVALGAMGILSFVGTALLAIGIAFLVLIVRQLVIIVLVLFAPIAIACSILPNTQGVYKLWYESFTKALMMFPIIVAFLAIGKVFAVTAVGSNVAGAKPISQLVGYAAYILPYFLIPLTFKLAGGALRTIGGSINDKNRGGFDRLKKFRSGKVAGNVHDMKTGDRFQGNNPLARGFNATTMGVASGAKGHFGLGTRGTAMRDQTRRAAIADAKKAPMMQQLGFDDNAVAVMALSGGTKGGGRRVARELQAANGWTEEQYQLAVNTAETIGYSDTNAAAAIDIMAMNKSRALPGGRAGVDMVQRSAAQISHGNEQLAGNMMGSFAFNSRQAGRLDHGGEDSQTTMLQGWRRASTGQHAQSYAASLDAYGRSFAQTIQTGAVDERRAAAVALLEMQNMLPQATGDNQIHINSALAAAGVNHATPIAIEQQLVNIASYGNNTGPAVPAGAAAPAPIITVGELTGQARVYDRGSVPYDQRNGTPPAAAAGGGGAQL